MKSIGPTRTVLLILLMLSGCKSNRDPELVREVPWALVSPPLVMDIHTHTRHSDGKLSVDELVQKAQNAGCDALAITDHGDLSRSAATPEYFEAIETARQAHPGLLILTGLEWNIPPYGGREHATLLVAPAREALLAEFRDRFERSDARVEEALRWLNEKLPTQRDGVLFYNHPSRKDQDPAENEKDFLAWHALSPLMVGFEGGPGHQKADPIGSYRGALTTIDRWDPVVARIGGTWDRILDKGIDAWGALADSDYHNDNLDEAPCAFARIHLRPEDPSPAGIIAGFRAGTFWSDHGQILENLSFMLNADGLPLPAVPGEAVRLDREQPVRLRLAVERGPGAYNQPLEVELIGNGRSGTPERIFAATLPANRENLGWMLPRLHPGGDGRSAYFRLRIRLKKPDGPDLMAYTNPIRVFLD